jgi:transcription-repair coupling factor (superfamily II helicase)
LIQSRIYEFQTDLNEFIFISENNAQSRLISDIFDYRGYSVFVIPEFRAGYGDDLRSFRDELFDMFVSLNNFYSCKSKKVLVSPIYTISKNLPIERLFSKRVLSFGDVFDIQLSKKEFLYWGYTFVDIIEERGEISIRGDIVDIFPINSDRPFRISILDYEIESIDILI